MKNNANLTRVHEAAAIVRAERTIAKGELFHRLGLVNKNGFSFLSTLTKHEPRIYETDGGMLGYDEGES